ncbi:MAG: shikimate kinase 1 [Gammaproteobacteria bacterium]|nr:MAG: shikimate kinase 1 [Gammaproteobacteria bacterium]
MKLIIIGPMASGKSVVGRKLSKKLGLQFFDTDAEIERSAGASISWIFDVEGEAKFREREYQVLNKIIHENKYVISTGGGIILKAENTELLKKGTVIYLETSIQSQLERTMNDKNRPLYKTHWIKKSTLRDLAKKRNPIYENLADIIINETEDSNQTVNFILEKLNR